MRRHEIPPHLREIPSSENLWPLDSELGTITRSPLIPQVPAELFSFIFELKGLGAKVTGDVQLQHSVLRWRTNRSICSVCWTNSTRRTTWSRHPHTFFACAHPSRQVPSILGARSPAADLCRADSEPELFRASTLDQLDPADNLVRCQNHRPELPCILHLIGAGTAWYTAAAGVTGSKAGIVSVQETVASETSMHYRMSALGFCVPILQSGRILCWFGLSAAG